jgi:DNA-binding response OmpR family regulator
MNKHVLIVDDNEDHANTLATIMRLKGYKAESVFDGESAIFAV